VTRVLIHGRVLTQRVTGVQRYARELVRALDALLDSGAAGVDRWSFSLLVPSSVRNGPDLKRIALARVGRLGGHAWEQLELPGHVRGGLLVSLANASPLAVGRQVVTIHDASVFARPETYSPPFRTWYRAMLRALGRRARLVVTDSQFSRSELDRFGAVPAAKTRVNYPGAEHVAAIDPDEGVLARHGLAGRRYVLAVGSLSAHKNLAGVVRAAALLAPRDFDVVVVGGADDRVFNRTGAAVPDAVRHLGYVSDAELRALYEHASCFLYPSFYEGFGLPPLEAMTLGCPVVASRAAALVEVCGGAALYCDPDDPRDIASGVSRVMGDDALAADLRDRGRARARSFTWAACARRTLDLLDEVARERAAAG
jgi:glycosyltransferase involved in cell wall biosynthesis